MLNKMISPLLEAVILKALEKDPNDRYPSASAMLEDLRRGGGGMRGYVENAGLRKRRRKDRAGRTKVLLASAVAAVLLLGTGTAAASFGYLGAEILPWQAEGALTTAVQPVTEDPLEAPETGDSEAEEPAKEPEQTTNGGSGERPVSERLAPVPNVNTYFDYFAVDTLRSSGFQAKVVYDYRQGYLNSGVTWGTDPANGTLAPAGSTVTVYATPKDQPQIVQPQPQIVQPQIAQPPAQPQIQP